MFDKNHDDRPDGPPMQTPEVPQIRTFLVKRFNAAGQLLAAPEEIRAHEVETNAAGMGNVIRFRELMIHPTEGPTNRVVRCIMRPADSWFEYEEVIPEPVEPSRILRPDNDFGGTIGGLH